MLRYWEYFKNSSANTKLAITALVGIWAIALLLVGLALVMAWGQPGQAQPPAVGVVRPAIILEPTTGPENAIVTVSGTGWPAESIVLIYLTGAEETELPGYAVASLTVDGAGQFAIPVTIPADARWEAPAAVKVIARTISGDQVTQALFGLIDSTIDTPETPVITDTPVVVVDLTPTATPLPTPVEPTATPTLVSQPSQPGKPLVVAAADVNIRSGPGTGYGVLGLLRTGQSAEVIGVSPDGRWWLINFAAASDGRGWLSAQHVTAQNIGNVPVVQPPALPAPPTTVVITDWRGEYYNNITLGGSPTVVRNDLAINFDWGNGAPATGVSADNFSARWSRSLSFPAGTYRFYVQADDGVRLWVDDRLVINEWRDGAPRAYTADVNLTDGVHRLVLEYYERSGGAVARLDWTLMQTYPDWKGEYFDNPNLSGAPVLVRNDLNVNFSWGPNSPGAGIPSDHFSARWSRDTSFSAGTYQFKVLVDDGVRLWIDNNLVIDQWRSGEPRQFTADVTLSEGLHRLRLEYFEVRYDAQVRLSWERMDHFPDWKAEYYNNRTLSGNPVLVRNESKIDYKWGTGGPAPQVQADNFSARWSRKADFQEGIYLFQVMVDDGVRMWLDDTLIIDSWRDGSARLIETERRVSQGRHNLKVEYYEGGRDAQIEVKWQKRESPANQAPRANPGGPYGVDENSMITFDGRNSRDPDGSIVHYEWNFNYNGRDFIVDATGPTASTQYSEGPANLIVALRVTDNRGATHVATVPVTVRNVAPVVEAGGPYSGPMESLITLIGKATDPSPADEARLSYGWDFGDGTTGSGPVVSHSYTKPGTYVVTLVVTDKDGGHGSDTATVHVTQINQAPQAVISGPSSGLVGEQLSFSGAGSTDPDGTIAGYAWDFGDGATAGGPDVHHAYTKVGSYQVSLTVTDNRGLPATVKRSVTIEPAVKQPPVATITGPQAARVGQAVTFDSSGSYDPDGSIKSYLWDFGDRNNGSGAVVSHVFKNAATYQVRLTVIDSDGLEGKASHTIRVEAPQNQPPQAAINGPNTALVGEEITFDGSKSQDPDGSIASYVWNFGDGSTGQGVSVSHSYSQKGVYQVSLTVTDNQGLSGARQHTVQVDEAVKPPQQVTITAPSAAHPGHVVTFTGHISGGGQGTMENLEWNLGDGSLRKGPVVEHTYYATGTYTVTLKLIEEGMLVAQTSHTIQIVPAPSPPAKEERLGGENRTQF